MSIADLGRMAIDTASKGTSPLNTVLGGLAKGAEAHLNLKKMFDMYSMQMQWQEAYEGRKRTAEHAQTKELKGMEQKGLSERTLMNLGAFSPIGEGISTEPQYPGASMPTSEGGSVGWAPGAEGDFSGFPVSSSYYP